MSDKKRKLLIRILAGVLVFGMLAVALISALLGFG